MQRPTTKQYLEAAQRMYAAPSNDDIEIDIDIDAIVSKGDDPGAWVHAWVWVRDEDALEEETEE
jgi:hypothetical protein